MDKKKIKRIIVREGLILFIAIVSFISAFIVHFNLQLKLDPSSLDWMIMNITTAIVGIVLFGYPLYLLIRFIIWGVSKFRK